MNEKVTPAKEHFVGTVMPGNRGIEQHGVSATGEPTLVDAYDLGTPDVHPEEPPELEPTPVRIVESGSRERRTFRTFRFGVSDQVSLLVGQDENRRQVRLRNTGVNPVFISSERHTTSGVDGWPIPADTDITLTTESAIYAVCAFGLESTVVVLTEYAVKV